MGAVPGGTSIVKAAAGSCVLVSTCETSSVRSTALAAPRSREMRTRRGRAPGSPRYSTRNGGAKPATMRQPDEARRANTSPPANVKTYENVPLMQFRLARCGQPPILAPLLALRKNDPRWNDTLLWEGRRAIVGSPTGGIDLSQALALYGEGRTAFPESLALTMAWANANLSAEEFAPALSGFDDVLQVFPDHRDALIGRVQALSYLLRHPEGVAAATRLIDLGTWHIGDAFYWRAWNRYHLKEYGASVAPLGKGQCADPLMTAIVHGSLEAALALERRGARTDSLPAAAGLGRVEQARRMLPAATPAERHSALAVASQHGHTEVVLLLIAAGEDVNRFNLEGHHAHATPLHQAIANGHLDTARFLVEHGARLDIKDRIFQSTPLGWADYCNQPAIAAYLRGRVTGESR